MTEEEVLKEIARVVNEMGLWGLHLYCLRAMRAGGESSIEIRFTSLDAERAIKILKAVREVVPEAIR